MRPRSKEATPCAHDPNSAGITKAEMEAQCASLMVVVAPRSAKLVEARGARFTLLLGYVFVLLGFLTMLLLWKEDIAYWKVALGYSFVGIGVGLAGTPASHSLTGSVSIKRVGMASGTADLQRDLGGAIMQSILGALLTAGYAAAAGAAVAASGENVNSSVQAELTKSFSSAADRASRYPTSVQDQIVAAAKTAFLQGDQWAYLAGVVAVLLGAALVFFKFPKAAEERRLLAEYAAADADAGVEHAAEPPPAPSQPHPACAYLAFSAVIRSSPGSPRDGLGASPGWGEAPPARGRFAAGSATGRGYRR